MAWGSSRSINPHPSAAAQILSLVGAALVPRPQLRPRHHYDREWQALLAARKISRAVQLQRGPNWENFYTALRGRAQRHGFVFHSARMQPGLVACWLEQQEPDTDDDSPELEG